MRETWVHFLLLRKPWKQVWVSWPAGSTVLFYFTTLDQVWYISQKGFVTLGTAIICTTVYNDGAASTCLPPLACS